MRSLLLLAIAVTSAGSTPGADAALELSPDLARLLDSGRWDETPTAFRIITLSHLADGCAAQAAVHPARHAEAVRCVDRALALGRRLMPGPRVEALPDALFLEHLNLILGARDALGPCADPALHRAASARLAALSLADPFAHAPSYASLEDRWPADQSAVLASLRRFDAAHGSHLLDEPLRRFREVMARPALSRRGLPVSEVTQARSTSRFPRGCAQSFISRYLAEADPALAHRWWATYRKDFLVDQGPLLGFREWPPGVEQPGDGDSGPIILGIGTAASALAIAAARAQGDELLATRLELSAEAVLPLAGPLSHLALAQAILFQSRWQRRID
jgi:hypothetical protein